MDAVMEWLAAHVPQDDETRIVHGDYRCDNMIFAAREPRVIRGTAASAQATERARKFPALARLARESMEACH